jgi:hypothetical protein
MHHMRMTCEVETCNDFQQYSCQLLSLVSITSVLAKHKRMHNLEENSDWL